ncbi:MAG: hypothetical protein RLZZ165_1484 [Bacteroidota bacterium]
MIRIDHEVWHVCWKALETQFECSVPAGFQRGEINLEALLRHLMPPSDEVYRRGRIVIRHDLRAAVSDLEEDASIAEESMQVLFPAKGRRAKWKELQRLLEWKLPRIGMPVWAQHLWGAGLLAGFVMIFIWPLWGLLLFFGGSLLSFLVEKIAWALPYPTFSETVEAMVRLNSPLLEQGVAEDHLRVTFVDALADGPGFQLDPQVGFPIIYVGEPFEGGSS